MKSTAGAFGIIVALGIVSGLSVFFTVFMYARYYDDLTPNADTLLKEASFPIRVTAIDSEYKWFEGERIGVQNREYESVRIFIDAKTYVIERVPRIENGVLVGYRSHHRTTPGSIVMHSVIFSALETREDLTFYTPIVIVEADEAP
ncbi:hypothetical protein COU18_02400 [Candidatus Kaiserbacteria bacterium CG10_big_fil_rev_8_21_14_0_10_51_14]|uniref:Uncharacterized protein n=1 Tax=Candidatus Kaiserbacteria bacterium CG10_big_fil_rev_8_21_14_0_10_51_14 TaxID=1974610 RepID=A0A2H0UBL0_9BACT|nr:MAG: hypothetical protein COU18_02400 [Candidatus Kaiserbacteria bacterium CG10_big_fil_rev_8_21_14_0_10_51_14]